VQNMLIVKNYDYNLRICKGIALFSVVFWLFNCGKEANGNSNDFLSLVAARSSNTTNEVAYGAQPSGDVASSNGVPSSYLEESRLSSGYQVNLNLLDSLGIFLHKNPNF